MVISHIHFYNSMDPAKRPDKGPLTCIGLNALISKTDFPFQLKGQNHSTIFITDLKIQVIFQMSVKKTYRNLNCLHCNSRNVR